ncbi:hypothetical protein CK203_022231 [Vitis vinifera]|uniref:Uncharacterized protein n=1 Tax=Vitis vinifera TaxID=29760 RepID=A0A438I9E7_VITVI|nr:hypothetical protein CK203_022231 [Vitis vinifera]
MHVSASWFVRLKVLQIDELTGLTRLNIDEGALPWLKQLQAYYGTKILGINNLLNLVDSRVLIERDHLLVPIQMPYPNSPIHFPWDCAWIRGRNGTSGLRFYREEGKPGPSFYSGWCWDVYMHVSVPLLRCDFDQASLLIHGQDGYLPVLPFAFSTTFLSGSNTLTRPPDKAHSSRPHGEAHNSRSTWGTYSTRRDYPIIRMVAAIFLAILRMGDLLIQKAVFLKGMQCFRKKQCKATQPKRSKMMDGFYCRIGELP